MELRLLYDLISESVMLSCLIKRSQQSRDPSDPSVMFVNPAGKSLGTIRSLDLMILRISDGSVVDEGATNMGCTSHPAGYGELTIQTMSTL